MGGHRTVIVADKAKDAQQCADKKAARIRMPFTHGKLGLVQFFKESFAQASKDHLGAFAGNLTYAALFALFPLIIFLLSLLAVFHATHLVQTLLDKASQTLPAGMVSLIGTQLKRIATTKATGAFTAGAIIAILGALWGVSGAFRGVMEALNVMYNVEETRPFWKKYGVSIVLSLMTSGLLVAAAVLVVAGPAISNAIARATGSGRLFVTLWEILQWPVLIGVVLVSFALMYHFAPNVEQRFRWITLGAGVALVFWLLYTLLFSLYVNNVGGHSYSATYGALAGIAIFMIYIHQTAYFFLLGAEMNQLVESYILGEEVWPGSDPARTVSSVESMPKERAESRSNQASAASPPGPPTAEAAQTMAEKWARGATLAPPPGPAEVASGRKILAASAVLGLASILFRWLRRRR